MSKEEIKSILYNYRKDELKTIARKLNVQGYSKKRKIEIIELLSDCCSLKDIKRVIDIGTWNKYKIHIIFGVFIPLIIGAIYFIPTATKDNQEKMSKNINTQGEKQDKLIDGQNDLRTSVNETNALVKKMRAYENDYALLQKYPLGYSLFSIDHQKNIIPYISKSNPFIHIDWSTGYVNSITPEKISIRIPDLTYNSEHFKNVKIYGNNTYLERKPGKIRIFTQFEKIIIVLEPLMDFSEGFVCLIGAKEESVNSK